MPTFTILRSIWNKQEKSIFMLRSLLTMHGRIQYMYFNPQSEKISRHVNNLRWFTNIDGNIEKRLSSFISEVLAISYCVHGLMTHDLFSLIFLCSLNNKSVHFPRKEKKNFVPVVFLHFSHRWKVVGIMWQYFFLFIPTNIIFLFPHHATFFFNKIMFRQVKFFSGLDSCCLKYKRTACWLPRYHLKGPKFEIFGSGCFCTNQTYMDRWLRN